jgi:hypothetical protein
MNLSLFSGMGDQHWSVQVDSLLSEVLFQYVIGESLLRLALRPQVQARHQ